MGGFTVNGFGASDHFKKIKSLGFYECDKCKKVTEHFLADAKFKIDILFIPTFTLKSRYAVMCDKCKNGEYCSDEWASRLINEGDRHTMIFESEYLQNTAAQAKYQSPSAPVTEQTKPRADVNVSGNDISGFFKCEYCGTTNQRDVNFCKACGKPAPAITDTMAAPAKKFCENCGSPILEDSCFCVHCGNKL